MSFELDDVRRLLDAFEDSDWDEIHLTTEDGEVRISTQPVATGTAAPRPRAATAPGGTTAEETTGAKTEETPDVPVGSAPDAPMPDEDAGEGPAVAPSEVSAEGTPVEAPSPGIFWHAPSPDAPPFVEVGQHVDEESPVGIVEVMKLFNQVLAGVEGTVTAVLVGNGVSVDRGQPLVLVDPDQ